MADPSPTDIPDEHARLNRQASVLMENGIALLNGGDPSALREAIRLFEEAIELRRQLPLDGNPGFRYSLSTGWINRGDAFTRLGSPENLAEAVHSYTAGIEILKEPPAEDDGTYALRLAIACANRGIALEQQTGEPARAEAVRSYKEARAAAERALDRLAPRESMELPAAEAGLKARHILSRAITVLLNETTRGSSAELDLINTLTDAVESAISLAQSWEKAGVTEFRPLATQFFHLGALAYENHQPHFLAEYLTEHLEPECCFPALTETWLAIARDSLARASSGLGSFDFASLATQQGIRRLEILNGMRAAGEKFKTPRPSPNQIVTPES